MSAAQPKIVLTGVTGQLGGLVLKYLLEEVPAASLRISVRDPSKVAHLADQGVLVRQGDYNDGSALSKSFEGADTLLLVSSPDITGGREEQHRTAIEAAKAANIHRIYYTSYQSVSPTALFSPAADHVATEAMLEASGLDYVLLRNGIYMNIIGQLIQGVEHSNVIAAPRDGPVAWTAVDDLARATAKLLLRSEPRRDRKEVFTLASTEALDMADIARMYGEVTGKPVQRVVQEGAEWREGLTSHGVPGFVADMLLSFYQAAEHGELVNDDDTLARLLDGKVTTVKAMLRKM